VKVKTVDLTTSLESLSYFLARPQETQVVSARRSGSTRKRVETRTSRQL